MEKVKIGIIGCGTMAQWAHLPCFASLEDVEIKTVFDPAANVAEYVCHQWGIENHSASLEELLESDIDAVCILTKVQLHKYQTIKALEAGKHVFIEKPLAMSVASAKEIRAVAEKTGKLVMVGYMKQHEANIETALERMKTQDLGKMLFARTHSFIGSCWDANIGNLNKVVLPNVELPAPNPGELDFGPEFISAERDQTFYSFDNPFYALLDTGCHSINILRYITGKDFEPVTVFNESGTRLTALKFDTFTGTMEFCINFSMCKWDEVHELYFEKGMLKINTPQPTFTQASASVEIYSEENDVQITQRLEDKHDWSFLRQAKSFINKVRKNQVTMKYLDDSVKDIEVVEKIYKMEHAKA